MSNIKFYKQEEQVPLEMHKVRVVQKLYLPNVEERVKKINEAGNNTFLLQNRDVYMDMLYMPDALRSIVELMEADPSKLKHRNSFNVASMSFTPEILAAEIRKRMPSFEMDYNVDPVKEAIANSWPNKLDDSCAREEWGWKPQWDLSSMTDDMLEAIRKKDL